MRRLWMPALIFAVFAAVGGGSSLALSGYWRSGRAFLGLSYALASALLGYVGASFLLRKRERRIKSLLAGATLTGALWLGLCALLTGRGE